MAKDGAAVDGETSPTVDFLPRKLMSNFKSGLLRHALAISLGLLVLATHAQEDPPPKDIPGTDTFQEFHGSTQSRASVPSSHSRSYRSYTEATATRAWRHLMATEGK